MQLAEIRGMAIPATMVEKIVQPIREAGFDPFKRKLKKLLEYGGEPFAATSPTDKGTPKKTFFQWFVHRGILWQFGVVLSLLAVMLVLLLVGVER